MKKIISLFLILFTFIAVQAQETPAPAVDPNGPEMTFENEVYDYGRIKQGANGDCEFTFTNTGKKPLIISSARGSCGCTVPTYPKEPIKKGQKAKIKVHYDTNRVGVFTKTVTVVSNGKTPTKTITIKGDVEAVEKDPTTPLRNNSEGMPFENQGKPFGE
jgi:hypothetical protein